MTLYKKDFKSAAVATMGNVKRASGMANANKEPKDWGLINVSVCNMRIAPDLNAGMSTQGLLGMPVHILKDEDWLQVETPDGHAAWVHPSLVHRVTRQELSEWNKKPQLIITSPFCIVYSQPRRTSRIVSDVVACNRLMYLGARNAYYKVVYPDGRIGYVSKRDADEINHWRKLLDNSVSGLIKSGMSMLGFPYMWGGMSTKGMDCSGFIRTMLLMHDVIMPRNASQMARKGRHIDIASNFTNIEPGDLIFFGQKANFMDSAKVSHVAFYIGNRKFLHSLGMVRIGSFDPKDPFFELYGLKYLLWAQRILPYIDRVPGLFTTPNCDFYK